ncbi:MAG: histone H1 [Actinobacteria bacterium QS_8_72_14]|nr:MAG: histone H1 [Actinobacteria bacterium QS_8_72_14]
MWSAQGQRLLSSELYDSKQAARNAIAAIRRAASEAEIVDSDQSAATAKKATTGSKKAAKKAAKKSAKKSAAKKAAKKSAAKKGAKKSAKKSG